MTTQSAPETLAGINSQKESEKKSRPAKGIMDNILASCSFCGVNGKDTPYLVAGPEVHICAGCVSLCYELITEKGIDLKKLYEDEYGRGSIAEQVKQKEVTPTKVHWSSGLSVRASNALFELYDSRVVRGPYDRNRDLRSFDLKKMTPSEVKFALKEDIANKNVVLKTIRRIGKKTIAEIEKWVEEI